MAEPHVEAAGHHQAREVLDVLTAAYTPRPRLDPPSSFPAENADTVASSLARFGGLVCRAGGEAVGALLFGEARARALELRRLGVVPSAQRSGVATALVSRAEELAAERGYDDVTAQVRTQLPEVRRFWVDRGYAEVDREPGRVRVGRALPVRLVLASADSTRDAGRRLAELCRAGDVLVLSGELGAGKTTLTSGIGAGLGVRGQVTSPTFVISRLHPSQVGGPALLHVDAYRLGSGVELDDLDLDAYVDSAVTVVEWGEGIAEALSPARLRVSLARAVTDDDERTMVVVPEGARWVGSGLRSALLRSADDADLERRTASAGS